MDNTKTANAPERGGRDALKRVDGEHHVVWELDGESKHGGL